MNRSGVCRDCLVGIVTVGTKSGRPGQGREFQVGILVITLLDFGGKGQELVGNSGREQVGTKSGKAISQSV